MPMSQPARPLHVVPDPVPDAEAALPPPWRLRRDEWSRAMVEYAAALLSGDLVDRWPRGDGHPVLVIPGFLAGEASTDYLRRLLTRLGYTAYDWGMARNTGFRPEMDERFDRLVEEISDRHGRSLTLIGWSAGGIYAREIARRAPHRVRMVVTLGSPFRGNHKASHAWWLWSLLNRGPDAVEAVSKANREARAEPIVVPTTCIYSRTDGIVAWECCTSLPAATTENVEVSSSHLGFGHNLETLYVIADRLAQPEGTWAPIGTRRGR
jgi:dienelactone hydrolase